jgi:uncharacterized repeat protein (TIGR03803 family)
VEFNGCGIVFQLTPTLKGPWTESVLHSFSGGYDGENPAASLLLDAAGNLYGTNITGGNSGCLYGCGVVFRLAPASGGWRFSVLHSFLGSDGAFPSAALISDADGNLYGTTVRGGSTNCIFFGDCGTIFELSPTTSEEWQLKTLHAFSGGQEGALPLGPVVFDAAGNLFGTTGYGGRKAGTCSQEGQAGCGVVFEMTPSSGKWTGTTLITFTGRFEGGSPTAGLVADSAGNLYGTTTENRTGKGIVFKIKP